MSETEAVDPDRSIDDIQDALGNYEVTDEHRERAREKASSSNGSIVVKPQLCGDYCSGCPHGPYAWRVDDDGWHYIGRVGGDSGSGSGDSRSDSDSYQDDSQAAERGVVPDPLDSQLRDEFGETTAANVETTVETLDLAVTDVDEDELVVETERPDGATLEIKPQGENLMGYDSYEWVLDVEGVHDKVEEPQMNGELDSDRAKNLYNSLAEKTNHSSGYSRMKEEADGAEDIWGVTPVREDGYDKVRLKSPYEAKSDIKSLDWETYHPDWDGDYWTIDADSVEEALDELEDAGWSTADYRDPVVEYVE